MSFKIKPELKEEWMKCAGNNCCDGYSFGVVLATIKVFEALDAGKTPKEADESMHGLGISGFMAGCVAGWVSKFHERGEEFRQYWNKEWGVTDEQAGPTGVVNPAVLVSKS